MDTFEELWKDYSPVVYRYLLSLSGDSDLADELTAETFYRAWLHIGSFRGDCKIETWLCQIAKNTLAKEQRRRSRHLPWEEAPEVAAPSFSDALEDRDTALRLHRCLHQLKDPYREVFMLRVFGELPFADIAAVCGKSESWAKVTYYRAKEKLIKTMEEQP